MVSGRDRACLVFTGWLVINRKAMQHKDSLLSVMAGVIGGGFRYLADAAPDYLATLFQASLTALVCGAAGYVGKELIVVIIKKITGKKTNTDEKD